LFSAACAETSPNQAPAPHASDLIPVSNGKADGAVFNKDDLISDALFINGSYLEPSHVQSFLEDTPYGTRSYLADVRFNGKTAAEIIVDTGLEYGINPLVLMVKLQVEYSLVYEESPSNFALGHAMGCGCYDNSPHCSYGPSGFAAQLACGAHALRKHYDAAELGEETVSGWSVDKDKKTLDDEWVIPRNAATASLYTYTPWVLKNRGGNWLFWNVLQRFAYHMGANQPNWGWIGSTCEESPTCSYDEGMCLETSNHGGVCSMPCELYCPDSDLPFMSVTFCAAYPTDDDELSGQCLARCDESLFPENDGCATSFKCVEARRFGDEDVVKEVCWPENVDLPEESDES